jgi:aminoglycoside phosphotransferase (APT) family kinase protein
MESTLAPTETSSLHDSLLAHLSSLKGGGVLRLENLHRIGGGSSRENWPFDLIEGTAPNEKRHELLLRRDPAESVVESDRTTEFELLRALQPTSIPSPEVLSLDASGEIFGRPSMIMVRNRGTASRHLLRDRDPFELGLDRRVALGKALSGLLADLHSVDLATHGIDKILTPPNQNPAMLELETWVAELDRQEIDPEPQLRMVASWLEDNIPAAPAHTVLVHGDFRPANVLIKDGKIEALLDWELARLGDPLDDLGWYTTPLYRKEHSIPGGWEVADFIHEYERAMNLEIDAKALKFWQVMAMFRLSIIALTSVRSFLQGQSDRPTAPIVSLTAQTLSAAIHS